MSNVSHRCRHRVGGGGSGGLGFPLESDDGFVLGDSYTCFIAAHRKNHQEGFILGDTVNLEGKYKRSLTEGIVLGETVNLILKGSLTEGLVLGDSKSGIFAGIALFEGLNVGETYVAVTTKQVGQGVEGINLGDSVTSSATYKLSLLEGLVTGDFNSPEASFRISDGAKFGDSYVAKHKEVLFEVLRLGDSFTNKVSAVLVEGVVLSDANNPLTRVSHTEGIIFSDLTRHITSALVNEGWTFSDTLGYVRITPIDEQFTIGESLSITVKVLLNEGLVFSDDPTDGTKVFPKTLTEGFTIGGPAVADFNSVDYLEGAKFGDAFSRWPKYPNYLADSYARNVGAITIPDASPTIIADIPDLGFTDGLGLTDSPDDVHTTTWISGGGFQGWTPIGFSSATYHTDPSITHTGLSLTANTHEIRKFYNHWALTGTIKYRVACPIYTTGGSVDLKINGDVIRTVNYGAADTSWTEFTDTYNHTGLGDTLTVEFDSNSTGAWVSIADVRVTPDYPLVHSPWPYRMTNRHNGSVTTLNNSADKLSLYTENHTSQLTIIEPDLVGDNSGDPNIDGFSPWWMSLSFTRSLSDGGAGIYLGSPSATGSYFGTYNGRLVRWATFLQTLNGSASHDSVIGAGGAPHTVILHMYRLTAGICKIRVEIVGGTISYRTDFGFNSTDLSNISLAHLGDNSSSGVTTDFNYWYIVEAPQRPISFPNDF